MTRFLRFCFSAVFGCTVFGAEDWPEFRGPTGQGLSMATNIPISWGANSNVAWKVEVPGRGWSSPVVSEGRIFLTTAAGDSTRPSLEALCFDAATGKTNWILPVIRPVENDTRSIHRKNSLASPTPIVRDGRVYVHFGHMGTACLDATSGKTLWTNTQIKYSPVHGNGGSPILEGDLLIFNCDAASDPFVVALDARTGVARWKTPRNTPARSKFSFATPLVIEADGKKQLISPASGFVGGYDPANGRELWRVGYGEGYSIIPRPVYAHGLIFVSSGYDRPELFAVKVAGARGDATSTHVAWTQRKAAPNTPSTLAVGDELYFVSDGGIASCVDARTGKVHWSERLGGDFSASPVFAEGRIYFQNEAGVGTVVKAGKSFEQISKNDLNERTLASPAVVDNALILRSEAHLWRIAKSGD